MTDLKRLKELAGIPYWSEKSEDEVREALPSLLACVEALELLMVDPRPLNPGEPLERRIPCQHAVQDLLQARAALAPFRAAAHPEKEEEEK
jgi:hypothetical protein